MESIENLRFNHERTALLPHDSSRSRCGTARPSIFRGPSTVTYGLLPVAAECCWLVAFELAFADQELRIIE
jgi:hypothetical protein